MSDDGDSDQDPPVASEADAGPNERDLATRYAEEDDFECDMTFFEHSTLIHCRERLRQRIDGLSTRIRNEDDAIWSLFEKLLEHGDGDGDHDNLTAKVHRTIAGHRATIRDLQAIKNRLRGKMLYVERMIDELDFSDPETEIGESESVGEPDTGIFESESEGEAGLPGGYYSDLEEERSEYGEERGESEADPDDTVHSGWMRLLRQHQIIVDVDAFLIDTNLQDVDIQPFVDSAEHGTAEEVHRGIDQLQEIFVDLLARRRARYSATLPEDRERGQEPFYYLDDAYDEDRSMEYFDIAEIVIENLINELRGEA